MSRYGPFKQPDLTITVWYNCRGARKSKAFTEHGKARRFFSAKLKGGHDPKLEVEPSGNRPAAAST